MWRRQNACSDRSPSARHTANTTEISTLPSGPFTVDHAIEFSKPCVRMHYTALYNVAVADNGVEPRTSTTLIMQTFPMPTPHVASLLVSSYVSAQSPIGEIGLHQLHWTQTPSPSNSLIGQEKRLLQTPIVPKCKPMKSKKKRPVSQKFTEASRLNSLFCLCRIPKLSKSMAQPDCCCRLTWAEINGIVASGCVWRPPSLHKIVLIPYDVHLHFLLFTCFFWKICSRGYSSKHAA